jgi:hypothetical protein
MRHEMAAWKLTPLVIREKVTSEWPTRTKPLPRRTLRVSATVGLAGSGEE